MSAPDTHLERFLARLPPDVAAAVRKSPELFQAQQTEVLLRGVSRGMDYLARVPEFFRARRWPHHEDAVAFVIAALCYFRWGQTVDPRAFDVRFRLPEGTRFDQAWRRLHRIPRPRARDVVRILDLGELAPTAGAKFTPVEEEAPEGEALIVLPGGAER